MKNMFLHFPESQTLCWDNSSNGISLIYTVTALAWLVNNNTKERNSPHIIINMCCSVYNALCTVVQLNRGRWRGKKLRNTAHSSRTHSSALSEEQVHDSPLLEPRGITNRSTHNSPKQLPSGCIIFIWITGILINWLCITNKNEKNDMTVKLCNVFISRAHVAPISSRTLSSVLICLQILLSPISQQPNVWLQPAFRVLRSKLSVMSQLNPEVALL